MKRYVYIAKVSAVAALLASSVLTSTAQADNYRTPGEASANIMDNQDWATESQYWRENYSSRPYYREGTDYSSYEPAYRYGADMYDRYQGSTYNDLDERQLRQSWNEYDGNNGMSWDEARGPVQDSYNRMYDRRASTGSALGRTDSLSPGSNVGTTGSTGMGTSGNMASGSTR